MPRARRRAAPERQADRGAGRGRSAGTTARSPAGCRSARRSPVGEAFHVSEENGDPGSGPGAPASRSRCHCRSRRPAHGLLRTWLPDRRTRQDRPAGWAGRESKRCVPPSAAGAEKVLDMIAGSHALRLCPAEAARTRTGPSRTSPAQGPRRRRCCASAATRPDTTRLRRPPPDWGSPVPGDAGSDVAQMGVVAPRPGRPASCADGHPRARCSWEPRATANASAPPCKVCRHTAPRYCSNASRWSLRPDVAGLARGQRLMVRSGQPGRTRADRSQRLAGCPVVMTAQPQVHRMPPAVSRWHHDLDQRPSRAAARPHRDRWVSQPAGGCLA